MGVIGVWGWVLLLLLVGAQVNVSWFAATSFAEAPPPLWVGGRFLWPFVTGSRTLIPQTGFGALLGVALAGGAGLLLLLAAAALLRWWVPAQWLPGLVIVGAAMSIVLHLIHLSGWSVFPILVDLALLWGVLGAHWTVESLRG